MVAGMQTLPFCFGFFICTDPEEEALRQVSNK